MGLAVRTSPDLVICEGHMIVSFSKHRESSDKDSFKELCEGADKKYGAVGIPRMMGNNDPFFPL